MKRGYDYAQRHNIAPLKKMVGKWAPTAPRTAQAISPLHLLLVAILSFVIGVTVAVSVVSPETVRRIQHKEGLF